MSSDYQRVVEFLRDLRQGPLQNVTDEITQTAADYAALCVAANDRLRKCSAFLQQGLRSEAIHLADESPNLLDLVAALDLPDPQVWTEFCQNNGLAVAPPLQIDRATQLNEAYSLDQPLESLLSRHRLLALSRAPVRERLEVLRRIAEIDTTNGAWEKDIRIFEKARLRELPTAFYTAVKNRDEQRIASLMTEINEKPWFEPVPPDLSTAVSDAFNRVQRSTCEAELRKLVEPLRDAFAARSVQECGALAQRWKKVMASYGVSRVSAELEDEIKPVVAFITEREKREEYMKRFRDSCKTFGQMLDQDAADAELEAGYAKLEAFKEPIPEDLTDRYAGKRQLRQAAVERRHKVRLMTVGASAAGIVVVVLLAGWLMMQTQSAQKWGRRIQQDVAAKRLDWAQRDIAELRRSHPGFLTDPAVAPCVTEANAMQARHDTDVSLLGSLATQVESSEKNAAPVDGNANASVDEMLATAANVQETYDLAQKSADDLAWVDADKRLGNGMIRLQALETRLRSRASAAVRGEVSQLSAKVEALTDAGAPSFAALARIGDRAGILKSANGLDEDTQTAIGALVTKINDRRVALNALRGVEGELDNIRQAAANPDSLKKAMEGYLQRFPKDARAADFKAAIARIPLDKAMDSWQTLEKSWVKQLAPTLAVTAQKRLDSLDGYLAAWPDSPMAAPIATYQEYLHHAVDAMGDTGTWQKDFASLVTHWKLNDLGYLETSDHHRFYVTGEINRLTRKINNQASETFEAIDPTDESKRITVEVDAPTTLSAERVMVPHVKIVRDIADAVKRIDDSNWDTWGIDITEQLRSDKELNVVVRATLIQQALKTEEGLAGWALGDTYTRTLAELARQKPETLPVVNQGLVTDGTRAALEDILKTIPAGASVKQLVASEKDKLFKKLSFNVAATTVALKDESGNWTISAAGGLPEGSALWTVIPGEGAPAAPAAAAPSPAPVPATAPAAVPAAAPAAPAEAVAAPAAAAAPPATPANPGSLLQIGSVKGGKYVLYENAVRHVHQGSVVYITRP